MQYKEQSLIEGLFKRLKKVEQSSSTRDSEADQQIQEFIQQQPSAPYYMAQSILIQEAALNRLNLHVQQLQNEVAKLKAQQQASSGFLRWLFGRCSSQQQPKLQTLASGSQNDYAPSQQYIPQSFGVGSFMSGALQTAAGVAGGVVLGKMLTNMFHHSEPQEIINIIDDPNTTFIGERSWLLHKDFDAGNLDIFNNLSDRHILNEQNNISNNLDTTELSNLAELSNEDDEFI